MIGFITLRIEEDDDIGTDENQRLISDALNLTKDLIGEGQKAMFKLTNLPPLKREYPGFTRASELIKKDQDLE